MRLIGIDPGVHTGLAVWDTEAGQFTALETLGALVAMARVLSLVGGVGPSVLCLYVEDARQRQWFGAKGREALQGAGSIKRDCGLWEEFAALHGITAVFVPPAAQRGATKLAAHEFQQLTGWRGRTSQHARDAAMLVWRRRSPT